MHRDGARSLRVKGRRSPPLTGFSRVGYCGYSLASAETDQVFIGDSLGEKDLSTAEASAGEDARVPRSNEHPRWSQRAGPTAAEGPSPSEPLKVVERRFGYPKRVRLLASKDFRRVYRPGRRASSRLFSLFYDPNHLDYSRFGITVSGKLGNATIRNRLKRRLREVFRLHREKIPPGWDFVVNPRHGAKSVPFGPLERDVLKLMPSGPPSTGSSRKTRSTSGDSRRQSR